MQQLSKKLIRENVAGSKTFSSKSHASKNDEDLRKNHKYAEKSTNQHVISNRNDKFPKNTFPEHEFPKYEFPEYEFPKLMSQPKMNDKFPKLISKSENEISKILSTSKNDKSRKFETTKLLSTPKHVETPENEFPQIMSIPKDGKFPNYETPKLISTQNLISKSLLHDNNLKSYDIQDTEMIDLSHIDHINNKSDFCQHYPMPNIMRTPNKNELYITAQIEGTDRKCLVDTGAEKCVLGKEAEDIWNKVSHKPIYRQINIRTAGGEIHKGIVKKLNVHYDNETKDIQFVFAPTIAIPIALGMNFCNAWNIQMMRSKFPNDVNFPKETVHDYTIDTDEEENDMIEEEEKECELTEYEKKKFKETMNLLNFSDGEKIGCQSILQHKIDTGDNPPIFSLPYRYNPKVTEKIKENIDRWIKLKIIETSTSEWRLPIVVVNKSDGTLRLCLDARKLNAITKKDLHIPPNVLHKIESLPHKAKFYVRLDLNEAFLQTKLDPNDRKKTAFSIPGIGEFQFIRMPFGLVNSPATQSRLMERIFREKFDPYIMHYLDDVIIMGTSMDHLIKNLNDVASILNKHNLTVSKKKTSNVLSRIRILGHIVDEHGIHTDTRKVKVIKEWKLPKTGKELQRFLGFTNWYRRFIKNYATLTGPLYEISKKRNLEPFWDEPRIKCFNDVKSEMIISPVLRTPDWTRKMIIQADASDKGTGAVLGQIDDEGNEYVIEYYSYKFTDREIKYAPTEKEMLAVLKAIRHFKYYIEFNNLIIYTDHHALQYLMNMKVMSGRLSRWILELQPFVNQIKHRAGKDNVVPDALSRLYALTIDRRTSDWYDDLVQEIKENGDNYPQYHVDENKIYRKIPWKRNRSDDDYRLLPHPNTWNELIKISHENTIHAGIKGTLYELKRWYWWPEMKINVREYISKCGKCASIKFPNFNLKPPLGKFKIPKNTMETLSIDVKGPLPVAGPHKYKYIITLIDLLSRYAWAKKVSHVTTRHIIEFLDDVLMEQHKTPTKIYHDNGSVFTSKEFNAYLERHNISSRPTPIYHPQANTVERLNRSLTEAIRMEISLDPYKQSKWASKLKEIIWKLNARVNNVTGMSPYEVHFGRSPDIQNHHEPPLHDENHQMMKNNAYKRSILRYLQNAKQFNKRALVREFKVGDIVMLRMMTLSSGDKNTAGKLFPPWEVAIIMQKLESSTYNVKRTDQKMVKVNVKMLKGISQDLQEKLAYLFE